MAVETFVAQPSMKALDKGVLHRLAGFNEAQLDAPLVGPLIDGLASQLRSVIQDDLIWGTALDGQPLQDPYHPSSWQRGIDLDRQHLPGKDIHDREEPDPPTPGQGIAHEIDTPLLIGTSRHCCSSSPVPGDALACPPPHRQTFLAIEPFDAFVVDDHPLSSQQHVQPSVAEPRSRRRQLAQPAPQGFLLTVGTASVPQRRAPDADQPAGPPLRHSIAFSYPLHRCPPPRGPQAFFRRRSFRIWLSRACSATSRLSRPFSSSRAFNRVASPGSSPPYFCFHR